MYTSAMCGFCMAARFLLKKKQVNYQEINVDKDPALRQEMEQRSGRHTVPQIFIHGRHIGGYDDLNALEQRGELDTLLTAV